MWCSETISTNSPFIWRFTTPHELLKHSDFSLKTVQLPCTSLLLWTLVAVWTSLWDWLNNRVGVAFFVSTTVALPSVAGWEALHRWQSFEQLTLRQRCRVCTLKLSPQFQPSVMLIKALAKRGKYLTAYDPKYLSLGKWVSKWGGRGHSLSSAYITDWYRSKIAYRTCYYI